MNQLKRYAIQQMVAVLPSYDEDGGNETKVLVDDGNVIFVNKKVKYVIQWIKKQSLYNVDLLMKEQQVCFAKSQILPIPLSPNCILLPIKYRKPVGENDGAYAYISMDWVERVEARVTSATDKLHSTVIFKGPFGAQVGELHAEMQPVKLMQQLAIAKTIRKQYFSDVYEDQYQVAIH